LLGAGREITGAPNFAPESRRARVCQLPAIYGAVFTWHSRRIVDKPELELYWRSSLGQLPSRAHFRSKVNAA
jgi:hypothetical protein